MDELEGAGRRGQEVEPTGGSGNDWGLDMDLSWIPGEKRLDLTDGVNLLNHVVAMLGSEGC